MTDERSGSEDPGPISGVDGVPDLPGDDVSDISDNAGPELTVDVDDIDPGSAGGVRRTGTGTGTQAPG